MCRRILGLFALLGVLVLSDIARAERRQIAEIEKRSAAVYVDMGVELRIVERDDVNGRQMVPGNPERMRLVGDPVLRGGIMKIYTDAAGNQTARKVRASKNPVVWFASQAQADLILHDGPIPWALVQGSEGSGKTTVLAMWTAFRVLEHIGHEREIGITAPTHSRLGHVKREIKRWWPPRWYRFSERNQKYTFLAGPSVQLVSAVQRSEEAGSPIQGANWVAHAGDEFQDHFGRDGDIIARGRSAPNGRYLRLNTSTFKDSPDWRTFRDVADKAKIPANDNAPEQKLWCLTKLLGLESPFISPAHWEKMRAGLTPREYDRRVLALDVGPERQVYYSWSRENIRPLPLVGARDVTREELAPWTPNASVLVGHDPGRRSDVSVFMKSYRLPGVADPVWFVVDEVTTVEQNYEDHVGAVVARLRSHWGCYALDRKGRPDPDASKALVRSDPWTASGNDEEHPDLTKFRVWQLRGVDIRPAAFKSGTSTRAFVPKEARIDMVNTLLHSAIGGRRLMVACDTRGEPLAKKVVSSFETLQRDEANKAEREGKGTDADVSHWTAAVGYGLWAIEKPRIERLRARAA